MTEETEYYKINFQVHVNISHLVFGIILVSMHDSCSSPLLTISVLLLVVLEPFYLYYMTLKVLIFITNFSFGGSLPRVSLMVKCIPITWERLQMGSKASPVRFCFDVTPMLIAASAWVSSCQKVTKCRH